MLETRQASTPELRVADGRILEGVAMIYGSTAKIMGGAFEESFEPGAFAPLGDVTLDLSHNRERVIGRTGANMTLTDGPERLELRAEIPRTRDGDDVLELVKHNIFRNCSVSFIPRSERMEGDRRIIEKAELRAIAICDRGAYTDTSVSTRQDGKRMLSGIIPYESPITIRNSGKLRKEQFQAGVWARSIQSETEDILIQIADAARNQVLGAKSTGKVVFTDGSDALRFIVELPDEGAISFVDDFVGALQENVATFGLRPIQFPPPRLRNPRPSFDTPEVGNESVSIRTWTDAQLRSISVQPRGFVPGSSVKVET